MGEWSIEPIWNNRLTVVLLTVVLLVLLALVPSFGRLSRNRRGILLLLRAIVILLVFLGMMRPTRVFTSTRPRPSVLAVLFDVSRSMTLPDRTGGPSRWESQSAAVERIAVQRAALGEDVEVRVYAYDSQLQTIEWNGEKLALPPTPEGSETDVGFALEELLRREAGKRLAGVILLGDGTQTTFVSGAESQTAARRLRDEFGAPLYAVAFGPTDDAAQAKDVAVERLDEQYTVFVKNELVVRGRLKITGYANRPVPVEMALTDSAGKEEIVATIRATARGENEGLEVEFPFIPQKPGHYKITVRAEKQPGEIVVKNNSLSAYLNVLEGGLRVLLIDGGKRSEYKFLRRSLNDSPDIELDDFLVDSLNRDKWPVSLGSTVRDGKYDVFILGNVPAQALGEQNLKDLAAAVERGRGLLAVGGVRTFGAGNYYGSPLEPVLPIVMDRFEKQDFVGVDRDDLFLAGPLAMKPSLPHPITRLADANENESAWSKLPPLDFANRFTSLKASPGVRVLLQGPQEEALLVSGEFGNGRVLAFAGESTYRWVLRGHALEHKRFWRQAILWLARRDESQLSDVWLKLAQRRYQPGSNVAFTLGAKSPDGEVLKDAQFTAMLITPSGKPQTLRIVPGGEQWSGTVGVKEPGDYAIEITATLNGRTLGKSRAEFLVLDQDVELARSVADHEHLARLANITSEVGGRLVPPEELTKLLEELAARPPDLEVQQVKWRLGDAAWSGWTWLLCFAGVLTAEWWLRKKWGLV